MSEDKVYYGKVCWFDPRQGFGFLSREGEGDLFVHYSDLIVPGFKTIKKDQNVSFSIGLNNKGKEKAINVTIVDSK